jgi:hypothetical protein
MKKYNFYLLLFCFSYFICGKKYDKTYRLKDSQRSDKTCNDKLSSEVYDISALGLYLGVKEDYLTDSLNFRFSIGRWEAEHENLLSWCEKDSVFVEKVNTEGSNLNVIEKKVYSLTALKNKNNLEAKKIISLVFDLLYAFAFTWIFMRFLFLLFINFKKKDPTV